MALKYRGERYWEIDLLRGMAVVMMVSYHLAFDLDHWGCCDLGSTSGAWLSYARATATIFILLVGVSLSVGRSRARRQGVDLTFSRYLRRGARIFALGMGITAVTWAFLGRGYVIFGVLHLIGASIVLSYPFLGRRRLPLVAGSLAVASGLYLQGTSIGSGWIGSRWFLWLGLVPEGLYTLDYFPLLPWFGVVLVGMYIGNCLYSEDGRKVGLPELPDRPLASWLTYLGRNSLVIYLVHQPAAILLLEVLGLVNFHAATGL